MSISLSYLTGDKVVVVQTDLPNTPSIATLSAQLVWIDVSEMTIDEAEYIGREFKLHYLTIEDALEESIFAPKVQRFGDVIFMITHGIDHTSRSELISTAELDIWIGPNFVITNHHAKLISIDAVTAHIQANHELMSRGSEFLTYTILDALIGNFGPTMERMRDVADELEEQAIRSPSPDTLEGILRLKRSAMRLRRAVTPHRDIFQQMTRPEFGLKETESKYYFGDLYDRVIRISDANNIIFERGDNALALYQNSISIRQNEVMKVLAIVAGIFLPLGLFAGIFGMNFENMPGLEFRAIYFVILSLSLFAVIGSVWWYGIRGRLRFGAKEIPQSLRLNVLPTALTPAGKKCLHNPLYWPGVYQGSET